MTNKEILQKAINKAIENGWRNPYNKELFAEWSYNYGEREIKIIWDIVLDYEKQGLVITNNHPADEAYTEVSINHIIFSHEFAKAFWGDEEVDSEGRNLDQAWDEEWKDAGHHMDKEGFENDFGFDIDTETAWQYRLKRMVLFKNPLTYLEHFV